MPLSVPVALSANHDGSAPADQVNTPVPPEAVNCTLNAAFSTADGNVEGATVTGSLTARDTVRVPVAKFESVADTEKL